MDGLIHAPRETAVAFGAGSSLIGIWTTPPTLAQAERRTAVIMINAGIMHRVGPNRLYVSLARSLSTAGVSSLRFDMSGIGDSQAPADGLSPLDCSLRDIAEAIGWLEANHAIRDVILLGLCSGADLAVIRAASDRRVKGVILLDPNAPRTRKARVNAYRQRLVKLVNKPPAEMVTSLTTLVRRNLPSDAEAPPAVVVSEEELQAFLAPHYGDCVKAGVSMLAVFTGGQPQRYNYREQFLDAFPAIDFGGKLTLEYLPDSDHTFTDEQHRATLRGLVTRWFSGMPIAGVAQAQLDAAAS